MPTLNPSKAKTEGLEFTATQVLGAGKVDDTLPARGLSVPLK